MRNIIYQTHFLPCYSQWIVRSGFKVTVDLPIELLSPAAKRQSFLHLQTSVFPSPLTTLPLKSKPLLRSSYLSVPCRKWCACWFNCMSNLSHFLIVDLFLDLDICCRSQYSLKKILIEEDDFEWKPSSFRAGCHRCNCFNRKITIALMMNSMCLAIVVVVVLVN